MGLMVTVEWKGKSVFEAVPPSGNRFRMDSHPDHGGTDEGPTPVETLLGAIGACSAIDIVSILEKKRQTVTSYRVEVDGERVPTGTWPRPFLTLTVRHILSGDQLDPDAVARAVELSDEKYCSILATLRATPKITTEWVIE
jgi:putative redox protein